MKKWITIVLMMSILFILNSTSVQAQPNFTAHPGNPVLSHGQSGEWDFSLAILPVVLSTDSLSCLFYTGTNQFPTVPFSIGCAVSTDGYNFSKIPENPILTGDGSGFDSAMVIIGGSLLEGDSLVVFYGGDITDNGSGIGRATAVNPGGPWNRRSEPVLRSGSSGEWDDNFFQVSSVLKDGDTYKMFYSGGHVPPPGIYQYSIGMATSTDGIHWVKYDNPATTTAPYAESDPVLTAAPFAWDAYAAWMPTVIKTAAGYEMFYLGCPNQTIAEICYAKSSDGIHWTRATNNPIFTYTDDPYAVSLGTLIESPTVFFKDDTYFMYYDYGLTVGQIGLATAVRNPMTIDVPNDYPSIQACINAAIDGDIVLVADGTYYENINFKGKAITVASHFLMDHDTSHISATIINGSQNSNPDSGSVVYFGSGTDTTSVLYGFTITGGTGTWVFAGGPFARVGGGIFVNNGNAKIKQNYIVNNTVADSFVVLGGGLAVFPPLSNTFVIVENNTFDSNSCVRSEFASHSGGMFITNRARICNNTFSNNFVSSDSGEAFGGGFVVAASMDHILIYNNLIVNNKVETHYTTNPILDGALGGGFMFWDVSTSAYIRMTGNEIAYNEVSSDNYSQGSGGMFEDTKGDIVFANNIIHHNFYSGTASCQGSGLKLIRSNVNIINNTIADNEPSAYGGAVCSRDDDSSLLLNNILWGNSNGPTQQEINIRTGNPPIFNYCDIQGGWAGTGNINVDPLFCSDTVYCLSDSSLCVDAGHPNRIDPEDPDNPGFPLWPAKGLLRSDMGAHGGFAIISDILGNGDNAGPHQYKLAQNYPNPFNPSTTIEFSIPKYEFVTLKIYNLVGQEVTTLVSDKLNPGNYKYTWDASGFASGVYFYKLQAGNFVQTRKLILLR